MAKDDAIELRGVVKEQFPAGMFSVECENGLTVLATLSGKLRTNKIRVLVGDNVSVEVSPYDLTRGRISYRHR